MARLKRVKRRVLRQLVRENVDLLAGRLPRRRGRWLGQAVRASKAIFLVGLPLALFGSSYFLSAVAAAWVESTKRAPEQEVLASSQSLAPFLSASRMAVPAAGRTYPAPEPIDRAVLPVGLRRVVLDPGHGGGNVGTRAPRGLAEKEITLDVALRLRKLLERAAFEVTMTRDSDVALNLEERADLANRERGDIFISIHVNWIETRIRGVETYYLGPTDDPFLTRLAAQENRESGYTLADFRTMLERVYADVRQEESRRLARSVHRSLFKSLRGLNTDLKDRGVKTAPFGVLVRTEMPAILAEVSCLSNEREAELLTQPSYRQFIAEALFEGIQGYSDELDQITQTGS